MKKKAAKTHTSAYSRSQMRTAWLFLLPNFVGFMVFIVYPVIKSFVISFYDWDGLTAKRFVGLGNYIRLFQDGTFQISFLNNIHYGTPFYSLRHSDCLPDECEDQGN